MTQKEGFSRANLLEAFLYYAHTKNTMASMGDDQEENIEMWKIKKVLYI